VSQDSPPYSKKNSKIPHSFHTQNNIPSSLKEDEDLMPIINSLKQQELLISCSSPYNKFKILIKVNFKIQVTK
jgi:hypothetical protein